jgi:hypothetical protein
VRAAVQFYNSAVALQVRVQQPVVLAALRRWVNSGSLSFSSQVSIRADRDSFHVARGAINGSMVLRIIYITFSGQSRRLAAAWALRRPLRFIFICMRVSATPGVVLLARLSVSSP